MAAIARLLSAMNASPGGTMSPFWEPVTHTSIPHLSNCSSCAPIAVIPSTQTMAFECSRMTFAMVSTSVAVPVDVSLCVR